MPARPTRAGRTSSWNWCAASRSPSYCDENKLSTRERLELFIQVCQAIQHAHQKGIIHRDIKPSNILVTLHDGVPVPKVIDFGIAKATQARLTDKTLFTAFEQFIGTPAYMSPEQAEMSEPGHRHAQRHLQPGRAALRTADRQHAVRREGTAGRPAWTRCAAPSARRNRCGPRTRLSQTLVAADVRRRTHESPKHPPLTSAAPGTDPPAARRPGLDRDEVPGERPHAALRNGQRPGERHPTALNNEAVLARPPSAAYRFQKLVRRNKLAFAAVTSVATVLVLGVVVSTWQAVRATRQSVKRVKPAQRSGAAQARGNPAERRG